MVLPATEENPGREFVLVFQSDLLSDPSDQGGRCSLDSTATADPLSSSPLHLASEIRRVWQASHRKALDATVADQYRRRLGTN